MQLEDVVEVLKYLIEGLNKTDLVSAYTQLGALLQQASQIAPSARQQVVPLNNQVVQLRENLVRVQNSLEPPEDWGPARRRVFVQVEAQGLVGRDAAAALDKVLQQQTLDPATAAQGVQQIAAQIGQLKQRCAIALAAIGNHVVRSPKDDPSRANVTITFRREASINTLQDLYRQARTWDHIAAVFCELTRAPIESPQLRDVNSGSLIVDIGVLIGATAGIATIVEKIFAVREKSLQMRKLALEIRKFERVDVSHANAVEEAADKELGTAIAGMAEKLLDENGWLRGSTERNELENRVAQCLRDIQQFTHDGGRIRFRFPPPPVDADAQRQALAKNVAESQRNIEQTMMRVDNLFGELERLRQLPPKNDTAP
ncbi:hypothetical protein [Polyangium jinanense]|uniref:Uncharacterized protein n=1 Tax=Polyangium jinanense TaxID=2829994 RepID=A0A9X4ATT6_9BACT|nr:hypothetical protein [Polyangium jinanense]MDC3984578.1 hypothetical protein [Polyangium jinanense]